MQKIEIWKIESIKNIHTKEELKTKLAESRKALLVSIYGKQMKMPLYLNWVSDIKQNEYVGKMTITTEISELKAFPDETIEVKTKNTIYLLKKWGFYEELQVLRQENQKKWSESNQKTMPSTYLEKRMPILIEREETSPFVEYIGLFNLPEAIIQEAAFGTLNNEKNLIQIYDKADVLLLESKIKDAKENISIVVSY